MKYICFDTKTWHEVLSIDNQSIRYVDSKTKEIMTTKNVSGNGMIKEFMNGKWFVDGRLIRSPFVKVKKGYYKK